MAAPAWMCFVRKISWQIYATSVKPPLPLLPAQILWLNVVTNGIEHVGLVMEPGEPEEFRRPPRDPREGILSRALVERVLLSGAVPSTRWEQRSWAA